MRKARIYQIKPLEVKEPEVTIKTAPPHQSSPNEMKTALNTKPAVRDMKPTGLKINIPIISPPLSTPIGTNQIPVPPLVTEHQPTSDLSEPKLDKLEVVIESIAKDLEYPQGYAFCTYRYTTAEARIGKLDIVTAIAMDTCCGATLIDRKFLKENIFTAVIEHMKDNDPLIVSNINPDKYTLNEFVSIEVHF